MAYKFKSRATADLIMLDETGKHIMQILGKTPGEPGIVTVQQIPEAIAALEVAVAEDESRRKQIEDDRESNDPNATKDAAELGNELGSVTLRQRVAPLLEMLKRSAAENKDVIWER